MPSEAGEGQPAGPETTVGTHPLPKLAEPLPCPRCQSTNTKFCYYNNYNLSQPRHFCKACRRYWTQGGALRNVPVGGGSRKSSKRSRSSSSSTSTSSSTTSTSALSTLTHESESLPFHGNPDLASPFVKIEPIGDFGMKENLHVSEHGNFFSLMNTQGSAFMGMGGYGPGFGYCEMGLGAGSARGFWSYPAMEFFGGGNGGPVGGGASTWQLGDIEGGGGDLVDGDCVPWPGLAITTPGKDSK